MKKHLSDKHISISLKMLTIIFAGIIVFAILLTVASSAFIHQTFDKLYEEKLSGPSRTMLAQYRDAGQYSLYTEMLTSRDTFIEDSKRYLSNRIVVDEYEFKDSRFLSDYNSAKQEMLDYTAIISELKDPKYNAMFRSLLEIQQSSGVESIYILVDTGLEDGYVYLFSTFYQGYIGVIMYDDLGTVVPKSYYPDIESVYRTGIPAYIIDKPERSRQGKMSHSFTPITDGYGTIVAIIGVDINLEYIGNQMNDFLTFSLIIAISISAVIIVLMLIMLQKIIVRPIKTLTDISTEIANGNVTVEIPLNILKRSDEMGVLGNSYEMMRDALEHLVFNNETMFKEIITGRINTRGNSKQFEGLFAKLIDSMNNTLDVISIYFDSIPASFVILDPGYDIVFSNQNFKDTFFEYDDVGFFMALLDCEEGTYENLKQELANDISQDRYECLRWLTINGEERCFTFICSSVSQGETQGGAVIVISDSTELVRAKDIALSANKAKSEFLSRVSHELRTPLNAIMSMAKLGLGDNDLKSSINRFDQIVTSSAHLSNIINDVLEMSRMESGKTEIRYAPMDIHSLIIECVDMLQIRAQENNNELHYWLGEGIPISVIGDEFRIKQILINLLSNSSKFTENGNIDVKVDCLDSNGEECKIRFTVSDTGIGMSESFLEKIFTPFEQEDSFLSRRYAGSGLGLSISNNLVNLMGGNIIVNSELGKGTTFVINFTFTIASDIHEALLGDEQEEDNYKYIMGKKILLVDDVEINRQIIIEILNDFELVIDEATNGEEALKAYIDSPIGYYNCVLMDLQMPKMDGYQATAAIRSSSRPDHSLPIIAMTANALKEDIDRTIESGMDAHLSKPIDFDLCIKTIAKYCSMS